MCENVHVWPRVHFAGSALTTSPFHLKQSANKHSPSSSQNTHTELFSSEIYTDVCYIHNKAD